MPIYQDKDRSILPESRNKARIATTTRALFCVPLGFLTVDRRCTSGFSPRAVRGPGSPSRPAPSVQMGAARHPGQVGPQPPHLPLPPAPTQNAPFAQVAPQPVSGGFTPRKRSAFCASAGSPRRRSGPLASAPGGMSGGIPPRATPPAEQGRARCAPVGRRAASPLRRLRPVPRAPQASPLRARGGSAPRWLRHSAALT